MLTRPSRASGEWAYRRVQIHTFSYFCPAFCAVRPLETIGSSTPAASFHRCPARVRLQVVCRRRTYLHLLQRRCHRQRKRFTAAVVVAARGAVPPATLATIATIPVAMVQLLRRHRSAAGRQLRRRGAYQRLGRWSASSGRADLRIFQPGARAWAGGVLIIPGTYIAAVVALRWSGGLWARSWQLCHAPAKLVAS